MTRKLQNPPLEDSKSRKRVLKPVVEKKRRDRINQSLAELRSLLLNHTSDPRLQNPKIEKAEILDLAVEHLQKWTDGKNLENGSTRGHMRTHVPGVDPPPSEAPALSSIESAGFQQCVAQLTSYMHRIPATQRVSLLEGLERHAETQQPPSSPPSSPPSQGGADTAKRPHATSVEAICERKEEPPKFLFPSLSPFQPLSCSTPCHDYLSPPPSPWLSPSSFSTYAASPPFPSFASHFSFPPSLSPLSSNTSFFTFPPTAPHSGPVALHCPPLTALRSPPHPAPRQGSQPNSASAMWRPWF